MSDIRAPGASIKFAGGGGVPVTPSVTETPITSLLQVANNLAELANPTAARNNLGAAQSLAPTAVKTSAYTAAPGDFIPVNVTAGSVAITLPTAPPDKTRIAIKMVAQDGPATHTVTYNCGGSDVFNKTGGATSGTLKLVNQAVSLQYQTSTGIWYVQSDDIPLSDLDARYAPNGAYEPAKVISTPLAFQKPSIFTSPVIKIVGVDTVRGQLLGSDRTNGNVSLSDNWGTTWSNLKGNPPNTSYSTMMKMLRFGSNIYALAIDQTDSLVGVYPAPSVAASGSVVWGSRVATCSPTTSSINGKGDCFNAGSSAMMLGDYGDYSAGPVIQRSLDGVTWTTVWGPDPSTRHVHAVAEDPYNPGTWYAALGDNSADACILVSTDNGTTWTTAVASTGANEWQSVQLSFDANYIYMASDRYGHTAFYMKRGVYQPKALGINWHANIAVPGGRGSRTVTDLATTSGSKTVTSSTAAFTSGTSGIVQTDVGRRILGTNIPATTPGTEGGTISTFLAGVSSATQASLSVNATATGSGLTATLMGDEFYRNAYWGAVDPATGIYYCVANDTSTQGNTFGIFACTGPGQPFVLIDFGSTGYQANTVFIANGTVFIGNQYFPTLSAGAP